MLIKSITYSEAKDSFIFESDKGEKFQVSYGLYIKLNIHAPIEIDADTEERLRAEDSRLKAYSIALNYASYMPRTSYQVRQRLRREKVSENEIEGAIEKLSKLSLLNDKDYAIKYAEEKQRLKNWSKYKIKQELIIRGLPTDYIEPALARLDPDNEEKSIEIIIEKKYSRRDLTDSKEYQRTFQALLRRGFKADMIKKALISTIEGYDHD